MAGDGTLCETTFPSLRLSICGVMCVLENRPRERTQCCSWGGRYVCLPGSPCVLLSGSLVPVSSVVACLVVVSFLLVTEYCSVEWIYRGCVAFRAWGHLSRLKQHQNKLSTGPSEAPTKGSAFSLVPGPA